MWTPDRIPDLNGTVAVVTGGNGGLGLDVVRKLAERGATVVIAARNQARASTAADSVREASPAAEIDVRELDLAALESVRACATAISTDHSRIDLLVNNAGVMGIPEQATVDGFEMQLGVNHLGHFVLTKRLLPALLRAPAGRVVSVTSFARFMGRHVRASDPHLHRRYGPWLAYGQAKLANFTFALELQRRLADVDASVISLAAHPGLSHTGLQARSVEESGGGWSQRFFEVAARKTGMPPEGGAAPILRAATDPQAGGGHLYGPRWLTFGPPVRRPVLRFTPPAGRQLWQVSETETGEPFDIAAIVRG